MDCHSFCSCQWVPPCVPFPSSEYPVLARALITGHTYISFFVFFLLFFVSAHVCMYVCMYGSVTQVVHNLSNLHAGNWQVFGNNFNFNATTSRGFSVLHLSAWNGQQLNLQMLFHGSHIASKIWIGSRHRPWVTNSEKSNNNPDAASMAPEHSNGGSGASCSNSAKVICWLPAIEIDKFTPPTMTFLPSGSSGSEKERGSNFRGGAGSIGTRTSNSTFSGDISGSDIVMTSLDLALMRGHLQCATILGPT